MNFKGIVVNSSWEESNLSTRKITFYTDQIIFSFATVTFRVDQIIFCFAPFTFRYHKFIWKWPVLVWIREPPALAEPRAWFSLQ